MTSPVQTLTEARIVTISSGTSITGDINMKGRVISAVLVPATWTAADITFQASVDGTTWGDLHNSDGEVSVTGTAGAVVAVSTADFFGVNFVRVRSGTSATPVNQGADRDITLAAGVPFKQ